MKRLIIALVALLLGWPVAAQGPILPAGSPGYLFTPPPTQPGVRFSYPAPYYNWMSTDTHFIGVGYRTPNGSTVYGVAVAGILFDLFPYLWIQLLKERRVDSTSFCYDIDEVQSELFCFIDQPPVISGSFRFVSTSYSANYMNDTVEVPFYEFYFKNPIQVPANERYYVGVRYSRFNVWNHVHQDNPYWPYYAPKGILFEYDGPRVHDSTICTMGGTLDGLDSVWGLRRAIYPGRVDWACYTCTDPPAIPGAGVDYKYILGGSSPSCGHRRTARTSIRPITTPCCLRRCRTSA